MAEGEEQFVAHSSISSAVQQQHSESVVVQGGLNAFPVGNLETEFQELLQETDKNEALAPFRNEIRRLHDMLLQSNKTEAELTEKCRELQMQVAANATKVANALKLAESDQATITQLKQEIEEAWRMADAAHYREQIAHDTIETLKEDITKLHKIIEERGGFEDDDEEGGVSTARRKEGLVREREKLMKEVTELRTKILAVNTVQEEIEKKLSDAEGKVADATLDLQNKTNELTREQKAKEQLENDLKEVRETLEVKEEENRNIRSQVRGHMATIAKLEQMIKEQKTTAERLMKEVDVLNGRLLKVQQESESHVSTIEKLATEMQQRELELKAKDEEVSEMRQDCQRMAKIRDTCMKKIHNIEEQKVAIEKERETLRQKMAGTEKDIETAKKVAEMNKKKIDDMVRERDILNKSIIRAEALTQKQDNMVKMQEQQKRNLELEIDQFTVEAVKQRNIISALEKERDKYIGDKSALTRKVIEANDYMKTKQMEIMDNQKRIIDLENRLQQQQNLFEAVRSDRNTFSKNLVEAQDEITELKQKLKVMTHQIEQLKDEIAAKESLISKEEASLQKLEREKENFQVELKLMDDEIKETKNKILRMQNDERKLQKLLADADEERMRQKKEMEQVMNERDILGTQLVRRNDELALLYEKIKILQSTLCKGEAQYDQRLNDIRLLRTEIKRLRQEKALLAKSVTNMANLRQEIYHLQKDLTQERVKCRALEEELQNPLNVHRWRKLEGTDPDTYELIQKIQLLQKRLLQQSSVAVEREHQLQEAEKLYLELRQVMARQPGPEMALKLQHAQKSLQERSQQMKGLVSELNMYETQISEYKFDMNRLQQELMEVKKKYFTQKRKAQKFQEKELTEKAIANQDPPKPRQALGGGFKLTTQPTKLQTVGTKG